MDKKDRSSASNIYSVYNSGTGTGEPQQTLSGRGGMGGTQQTMLHSRSDVLLHKRCKVHLPLVVGTALINKALLLLLRRTALSFVLQGFWAGPPTLGRSFLSCYFLGPCLRRILETSTSLRSEQHSQLACYLRNAGTF